MATNDPTPNPNILDIVKLINLEEETILVAKCSEKLPEGTKIKQIQVLIEPQIGGGGPWICGINWGAAA